MKASTAYWVIVAILFAILLWAGWGVGAQAQGCGCSMPPGLLTEPATPTATVTPTVTPFATLAPPPGPCREHGCPRMANAVYLPLVGG